MNKEQKGVVIEEMKEKFAEQPFFYVVDASAMTVELVNKLRRKCFENGIEMQAIKNTLAVKALKAADDSKNYAGLFDAFHGPTALLFSGSAKVPATLIEEFRKENTTERPILKAAYIDTAVFMGDDQLAILKKLKSKEELVGEVIGLLQSPAKNVISALKSGGSTIAGLVKTLQERGE